MNSTHIINDLPQFSQIDAAKIESQLDQLLKDNREQVSELTTQLKEPTWETLVQPLETLSNRLHNFWSPINHMHSVVNSKELRAAYNACLPKLTQYSTELSQNHDLYQAFLKLSQSAHFTKLNNAQQKVITNHLRDFHLSGVALPIAEKKRYAEIETRLAEITTKFEEHLLDSTDHWTYHTEDANELTGIPQHVLEKAKQTATNKNLSGWILTLDYPCYSQVISYAENRALREKIYSAFVTRASDVGPHDKKYDNSAIMVEILNLRQELSRLLSFPSFADFSLATKMVNDPQQVIDFLEQLVVRARSFAEQELNELKQFAKQIDNTDELQPWDISYYSEKLCKQTHGINDEILRPYFPLDHVLQGMFDLVEKLYSIKIIEQTDVDTWHTDVRFFNILDKDNQLRGQFYLDTFARNNKRSGAWMDDCQARWKIQNQLQIPVAYLTCNLTPPTNEHPALLTHDEALTLFHEFGHGLHHMLTLVDYLDISGISGVEWDAVELPSQFMEYFVWEKTVLKSISSHYQTHEPLPDDLIDKLQNAKNFQTGMQLIRQLEFALFDFRLHLVKENWHDSSAIQNLLDNIREKVAVIKTVPYNRFQHSFSHIFAGGYAAGYYSYLWAEVLAADAFSRFHEEGIFNNTTGQAFLDNILTKGGSAKAMELFTAFRGRSPQIDALLFERGLKKGINS